MARFTPQQLDDLAQHYHDLSFEVGRDPASTSSDPAPTSPTAHVKLQTRQFNLLNISTRFATEAANLEISDADAAANAILVATKAADTALDHLKSIDKALNIASAAFELGTAISPATSTRSPPPAKPSSKPRLLRQTIQATRQTLTRPLACHRHSLGAAEGNETMHPPSLMGRSKQADIHFCAIVSTGKSSRRSVQPAVATELSCGGPRPYLGRACPA